jgi:hypothetical protein
MIAASLLSAARGAEPNRSPFDGQWSLEFSAQTRPGGETRTYPNDTHQVNLQFLARRESFTIAADGSVQWEQRDGGVFHSDTFSRAAGTTSVQEQRPVLRVSGVAKAMPAPAGSGRTYDRQLTLDVAWTGGDGTLLDHGLRSHIIVLSADGNHAITSGYTVAADYQSSHWELAPASIQREEIAPDAIRETTTFRLSRETATQHNRGQPPIPLTERIEIKHIHYLNLVPRG